MMKVGGGTVRGSGLGSHLVATLGGSAHFFRFWLHFLSILSPFRVSLASFSTNFGCFCVCFFGSGKCVFLGCWFIVLLSSQGVWLLGCQVIGLLGGCLFRVVGLFCF